MHGTTGHSPMIADSDPREATGLEVARSMAARPRVPPCRCAASRQGQGRSPVPGPRRWRPSRQPSWNPGPRARHRLKRDGGDMNKHGSIWWFSLKPQTWVFGLSCC